VPGVDELLSLLLHPYAATMTTNPTSARRMAREAKGTGSRTLRAQ
jgi:hypothetical protein